MDPLVRIQLGHLLLSDLMVDELKILNSPTGGG